MKSIFASVSLLTVAIATSAFAQAGAGSANQPAANPATLGEIIVTAQRRAENLQNVPIAVTAVTPAQIANSGVSNVQSLSVLVPGLQTSVSAGNADNYIRGVGSQVVGPGLEAPVALYVDGVYYASTFGSPTDLANVSQVDVLKGPQGTLFGRNATGGLIQITTRTPTQTPHVDADVSYGNYDTSKVDFYGTRGLSPNLAADFSLLASHQGDGYGVNLNNGKAVDKVDSDVSLRSKWLYTPRDGTRVTLIFDYSQLQSSLNSLRILPGTSVPVFLGPLFGGSRYDIDTNTQPVLNQKGGGASLRLEQDVGFAQLVDTVAYRQSRNVTELDLDTTATSFSNAAPGHETDREFTNELQLQSKRGGRLTWTTGAYFYRDIASEDEFVTFGPVFRALSHQPLTGQHVDGTQSTLSAAGYGQATLEVLPSTNLTVGGRYTYEDRSFSGSEYGLVGALALPVVPPLSTSKAYYRETYRVALDHRFSRELMAYASVNTGFKSGGYNALAPNQPPFSPEILTAYAGGFKADLLDRRLRVNLEGFYYNYSQLQVGVILTPAPGVTSPGVINGGAAHDYGLDADVVAQVTHAFRVSGGLELLHSRFISSANDFPIGSPSGKSPVTLGSVIGNTPAYSPSAVVDAAADYVLDTFGGKTDLNLTYQYNDGYFLEADNVIRQPSFSLLNASARWKSPDERYTISLWGKNLTDAAVLQNELTISFGPHGASYLAPRTFGFTVGFHM